MIMVRKRLVLDSLRDSKPIPDMRRIFVLHTCRKDFSQTEALTLNPAPPSPTPHPRLSLMQMFCLSSGDFAIIDGFI